jgi:hypothetical protein
MTRNLIDRLAQDYAALAQTVSDAEGVPVVPLPQLVPVRAKVTAQPLTAQTDVELWVAGLELAREGWVRRQSRLSVCPRSDTADPRDGLPLAGEWAETEHKSHHLLFTGKSWMLWTREEADANAGPSAGELVLKEEITLLADRRVLGNLRRAGDESGGNVARGIASLRYGVYWGGHPQRPSAVRRQFARFLGFSRDGN